MNMRAGMRKYIFQSMVIVGLAAASCSPEPLPELPQPGAIQNGQVTEPRESADQKPQEPQTTLSFRMDILPMLSSNKTGRVFKCTTCHPAYTSPETLKLPGKIAAIIQEVQPEGRMPPNGDKFLPQDIQILLDWQNQGFPE